MTKWPTIDRASWQRIHKFRDNGRQSIGLFGRKFTNCAVIQGEGRMLLKGNELIALCHTVRCQYPKEVVKK
jgi:hypothetical protein